MWVVTEPLDTHLKNTDKQNHRPVFAAKYNQQARSWDSTEGHHERAVLAALDRVHASPAAGEGNEEFLPTQSAHFTVNAHFLSLASPRAKGKVYNFHFQASPRVTLKFT